ncbi:hypothetical protein M8J76_014714 [Diaphorina citri]|nr:hypothetical protein M8J76_014714 [Diaphorina citri]KAI5734894.1 hypothetical protein M8J77_011695 [Diaphorina citri]
MISYNWNRCKIDDYVKHFNTHNDIKEYQAHGSKVHSVAWSCDGRRLASGSFDKSVAIFALDKKGDLNKEVVYRGHTGSVDQLCWHATNPDLLSTASGDKTVRIWDARTQKSQIIATKGENINITWAPNGNTIAVGNKEDLVTFIDVRMNKITTEKQFNFEVNEISWNNSSDLFFLTNGDGYIYVLSYPELEEQNILKAHPVTCICIEFDPTGKYFAVGSKDALVSLWDAAELTCIRTFQRLDWPVRAISFSHDGALIASGSEDLTIDIAHVESGKKVYDICIQAATFTVAWHPKQYLLAYACDDKYDRKQDCGNLKVFGFLPEPISIL